MVAEKTYSPMNGWFPLFVNLVMIVGGPWLIISNAIALGSYGGSQNLLLLLCGSVVTLFAIINIFGFMAIQPNQARVLLLFGKYKGSALKSGFFWVNPFFSKKKISLRIRNFETGSIHTPEQKSAQGQVIQAKTRTSGRPSKVNDRDGNPIEISAVVVWRVVNTAEALFEVDDYEDFVAVQSEAALRNMATRHPYDSSDNEISLRGSTEEICDQLETDIQDRLDKAGVEVIEARISHLAYSPEIAAAMLQRQQAQAVVAARTKIVEGAVGMVEMALHDLSKKNIIELDDERRAAMVSNLLVVLCSDRHTQPVVNTGTLYT
jgi:regulator of protease activity HflC (stomatin/prohibitin superfamily)